MASKIFLTFHADSDLKQGKKWSHYGALRYRRPRDQCHYRDGTGDWFDPGNSNYKEAVLEVDNTNRIAREIGLTDEENVADIVEGLIGFKIAVETNKGPNSIHATSDRLYPQIALTVDEIAAFWSTVAYTVYHRNIVREWIQSTQIRIRLATEQTLTAISMQHQSASARDSLGGTEQRQSDDVEIEEILRCDLFNMAANLMSCLYSNLPMHYIEKHITEYILKVCKKKEERHTSSADWKVIRDIAKFFVHDKEGQCKDPEKIIDELEYLVDIRNHVLKSAFM